MAVAVAVALEEVKAAVVPEAADDVEAVVGGRGLGGRNFNIKIVTRPS